MTHKPYHCQPCPPVIFNQATSPETSTIGRRFPPSSPPLSIRQISHSPSPSPQLSFHSPCHCSSPPSILTTPPPPPIFPYPPYRRLQSLSHNHHSRGRRRHPLLRATIVMTTDVPRAGPVLDEFSAVMFNFCQDIQRSCVGEFDKFEETMKTLKEKREKEPRNEENE